MTKVLKCADLVPGCDFEARGDTEDEILQAAAAHAKNDHAMAVTPALVEQVKAKIRDE